MIKLNALTQRAFPPNFTLMFHEHAIRLPNYEVTRKSLKNATTKIILEKRKSLRKSANNTIHSPIKIGIKTLQLAAIFQYYTCNC